MKSCYRVPESAYYAVAQERGFEFVGPYTGSVMARAEWRCQHGHTWKATYNNVATKHSGCPRCYFDSLKGRPLRNLPKEHPNRKLQSDYIAMGQERGVVYLSGYTGRVRDYVMWQCEHGHRFQASYHKIRQGRGCPRCSGQFRHTETDYHALAHDKGFEWIGVLPRKVTQKTLWRCQHGHEWKTTYGCLNSLGTGCPDCYRENNHGENHHSWDPSLTDQDRQERRLLPGYTNWVLDVKERDQWTCQACQRGSGMQLVSHHLNSYRQNPELRLDLDNGACLCVDCHREFHRLFGLQNNMAAQLEQFICQKAL